MKNKLTLKGRYFIVIFLSALFSGSLLIASIYTMPESKLMNKETPIDDSNYTSNVSLSQESENTDGNKLNKSTSLPLYSVKEYEGVIGIYRYGEAVPYKKEMLAVDTLPEEDREILKKGRDFFSYKELVEFIMDYE